MPSIYILYSSYPAKRVIKDGDGQDMGAVGSVDLLQNVTISTQPVSALDWSPDKVKFSSVSYDHPIMMTAFSFP